MGKSCPRILWKAEYLPLVRTDEIDHSLLVPYTQSLGEEDSAYHTEPQRGCAWQQSEAIGEAGFVVTRGVYHFQIGLHSDPISKSILMS